MQGATVDCGLFVIGYAIAKLRGLPLQLFDQANMPAMREALAENLLRLGASVVSPETAAAAQTLLQCHDNPVRTGHARRRSEAKANLEPYVDCMANQYNKSSKVQMFEVGTKCHNWGEH
ncbi:TPA: hypothetical protein ACH3X1_004973 [Trebouxia sp. C0004]